MGDHIEISHRILPIAATEESLESSVTSRCPSRSLLVVGPKLLAVEMNEVELSASRCVMVRRAATSVGIAAFVAQFHISAAWGEARVTRD